MPATRRRQSSGSGQSGPKRTRRKKDNGGYGFAGVLLDYEEGQRRQESGTAQALSSARAMTWVELAEQWLADHFGQFTSEDICAEIGLPNKVAKANANNSVGALVQKWARSGRIRRVGYGHCKRPESHGATIAIWVPVRAAARAS